ncbi:MAG: InlB B-repeat-containing protein, partial [Flavobacteriaceae bacterium]|nr:InlB B-repeat-containing protein [Flavobacteriaceae bacterium]
MKKLPIYLSLLFVLTCAKEDSQAPNTPPSKIVKQYTLTASVRCIGSLYCGQGEGGSVSGGGTFASGTQVSLTATPSSGYSFSGWSTGSTTNPLTVTLNSNTTITANFDVLVNSYTLTVTAGEGGSVSSEGGEYEEGTEVTITATPAEGYEFTEWSDGNTSISRTLTLNSNINIQ